MLYVQDSLDGESKVFLDPNTLSEDGTCALSGKAFSDDDKILAYGLSQCGSDWITIHFKDVETGKLYFCRLLGIKKPNVRLKKNPWQWFLY